MPLKKSHRLILLIVLCLGVILSSAYLACRMIVPAVIQKNGSSLLGVPIQVSSGGINFLNATLWLTGLEVGNVPNSKEKSFLSLKYFEFNLSFTSFLANELIIEDVRFEEPVLNLERNAKGDLNFDRLVRQFKDRFRPRIRIGKIDFFHHYAIRHFSVKNGIFRHFNRNAPAGQSEWLFREIDFSFSEFDYPPQLDNPTNTSLHLSAKLNGLEEGKIRILGSGNFISNDKNFRVKSNFQNITLQDINSLLSDPAQISASGFSDIESAFNCEHNQLTIENHVTLKKVTFPENGNGKADEVIFGFSRKTLSEFFSAMRARPLSFDFKVSGNLSDPSFNLKESLAQAFFQSAHDSLGEAVDRLNAESLQKIEKLIARSKNGTEDNPVERLKQLLEKFSENQSAKKRLAADSQKLAKKNSSTPTV